MALIECKLGRAETNVAGRTYNFDRDKHGRFVAEVHDIAHQAILLSVDPYRLAVNLENPDPSDPAPTNVPNRPLPRRAAAGKKRLLKVEPENPDAADADDLAGQANDAPDPSEEVMREEERKAAEYAATIAAADEQSATDRAAYDADLAAKAANPPAPVTKVRRRGRRRA